MTLQELNNQPKYYKVLEKVRYSKNIFGYKTGEKDKMVGKILQVKNIDFSNGLIFLWDEKKEYHHAFYQEDLQLMTPVKFNGQLIGIGDWVLGPYDKWYEVYSFYWGYVLQGVKQIPDRGFKLVCAENGDYQDGVDCHMCDSQITYHQPLYQPEQKSDEQQSAEVLDMLDEALDHYPDNKIVNTIRSVVRIAIERNKK